MWSLIHANRENYGNIPCVRSKHALCLTKEGIIYLLGGRSGNLPMKDLWKYDPVQNKWEKIYCSGCSPPPLQEHTLVSWKDKLYVFGGEVGFASRGETPLWVFDTETKLWEKKHLNTAVYGQPSGRRGHTSLNYNGMMYVYGGYQDLKGSLDDLWAFDFDLERWHLYVFPRSFEQPSPRHSHTSVLHDAAMWVYGGMTDLQERGDFWKLDLRCLFYIVKLKMSLTDGNIFVIIKSVY